MRSTIWKKALSSALSLVMCGGLMAPALAGMTVSAATPVKIACVGDSITAGSQASNSTFYYPTQLQQLLGSGYEVKNFGVSGRTLLSKGDNPYIKEKQYADSKAWLPDVVTIMLGTNDAKPQNWVNKADFEADMKAMIAAYRELSSHPTVVIATSPTVGATNIGISEAVVTNEIVPLQKKVAADMGCPVIDINALTKGAPQNYADGIHPNDAGYTAMANMFYNGLQDIFTASIQSFSVNGIPASIDDEAGSIALKLPKGTNLTAIEPAVVTANGARLDKTGAQDFTRPVTYTVTSPDGKTTKTYTATITTPSKIKVACAGDSITNGVGNSGGKSYPEQLGSLLGSQYEVKNFGHNGATVQDDGRDQNPEDTTKYGYRQTTTYKNSLSYGADIVIVMIGGNDSKDINWKDGDNHFERDYRALIQSYLDQPQRPLVLIGTACAVTETKWTINDAVTSGEIAPLQRRIAAEMGLPLVDANALTSGHPEYSSDGVHLNDTGYGVVASAMQDGIKASLTGMDRFMLNKTAGVIDEEKGTVTVTMPAGTDVTALTPSIQLADGAAYAPAGAQDFSSPVKYTVMAADGATSRDYTVTVNVLPKIKVACVGDSMTAAAEYPNDLEGFLGDGYEIGRFGVNSTTAQKDGQKEGGNGPGSGAYINHPQYQQSKDFAPDIVLLTLGSNDSKQGEGQQQNGYNLVTNWKADSPTKYEADLTELVASYQALPSHPVVVLGTSPSGFDTPSNWAAKSDIVNNQIAPIQRKVAADMGCFLVDLNALTRGKETTLIGGDGLHPNFNGYYLLASQHYLAIQDIQAAIQRFAIGNAQGIISHIDKTIFVTVPDGTDLTALSPTITLAEGAQSDKSGIQNFGQPVEYTITGANGWRSVYTVSVTSPSGVSVAKIEMQTMPDKTAYLLGEKLDLTGATIAAIYTDGSREIVPVTSDMVNGYDWLTASKQELTVTYEGKTTTFGIQVNPYGLLGTFSLMSGKFTVLHNNENLLYADWKRADNAPIDLSAYGDRAGLRLEMNIRFESENPDVNPAQMWEQLVIKLRSADKGNVSGDPEAADGNKEHNYGWNLMATSFDETGAIHVSIPLDQAATNHKGVMDWAEVDRIIIQCYLKNEYKTNSIQHCMNISDVMIVDTTKTPKKPDTSTLAPAVDEAKKIDLSGYTATSAAAFQNALDEAEAYLTNPYAAQADVDEALVQLNTAKEGLTLKEEPSFTLGDINSDGQVTASDALLALQAATNKITLADTQRLAANVDGKDDVTANDALLILQFSTQKIRHFPAEPSPKPDPNPNPDEGLGGGDGADDILP